MIPRVSLSVTFLCVVVLVVPASGEHLLSPWDWTRIVPTQAQYTCPAPPAFSKVLRLEGSYIDKKYSIIDERKQAIFDRESAGPTHLGQYAALAADAWLSTGSHAAAACVYSLLTAAAEADAWADKMPTINSVYMQNWLLSGAAIAYLKVRNSGAGTAQQEAQIQGWFRKLSARVTEYFDQGRKHPGSDAWNNHMYWAGLSVAAAGIATGDLNAFIWGISAYEMGLYAIQPDGSLDAEMGRGQMALHYQLYALEPLIILAEFGEANSLDLYAERDGAIHRLVKFDTSAMKDPTLIVKRTGEQQKITLPFSGLDIGWAVPYVRRFPDADLSSMIAQASWVRFWQWGGAPPDARYPVVKDKDREADNSIALKNKIKGILAAEFPPGLSRSYFLGDWCAEGQTNLRGTITNSGDFLALNNGQGSTSTGELRSPFLLVAPAWNSVGGALTPDRHQIDWTNGTYWTRCPSVPLSQPLNLDGKWVGQGETCSIRQQGSHLQIGDTKDCLATGQVDEKGHVALDVSGMKFNGLVTLDGNHINWEDGTYWTRARVYGIGKE